MFQTKQHMKQSMQLPSSNIDSREDIELSQSLVFMAEGCLDDMTDCHSVVSDAQTLQESRLNTSLKVVNPSFKKNLSQSVHLFQKREQVVQKSQFILQDTAANKKQERQERQEIKSSSKKMIENDLLQLQTIAKKTEDLALKQREQRRQLKKLKKLYIQKVQELMKQEQKHKDETDELSHQIIELKKQQENLLFEKDQIEAHMKKLELEVEKTKQELNNFQEEKLELLRKIEILQINYDLQIENYDNKQKNDSQQNQSCDRISNIIHQNSQLKSINCELSTINDMIQNTNTNSESLSNEQKYKKIISLLCIKNQYLQQREIIKAEDEQKRYRKAISKLNEAVITREKIISGKNQTIDNLRNNLKQYQHSRQSVSTRNNQDENDKIMRQTSDSYFGKSARTSLVQSVIMMDTNFDKGGQLKDTEDNVQIPQNWKEILKDKISNLVKANTIVGFQQTYSTIQKMVIDIIELFSHENWNQGNLLELIESNLDVLNNCFLLKAKGNVQKIQKLMRYLQLLNQLGKDKQKTKSQNQQQIGLINSNAPNKNEINCDKNII